VIHSYPWYIADWRNSETRLNLSLEERGLYRELLDFCYVERSLPSDERKLARIVNCSDEEFQRSWPAVKNLFNLSNDRYYHPKVSETLEKLDGYHEQRRQAGIASGERRRNGRSNLVAKKGNEKRTPKVNPQSEPSHPIPSIEENPPTPLPPETLPPHQPSAPNGAGGNVPPFALAPEQPAAGGKRAKARKSLSPEQQAWFAEWWPTYWRRVARKDAEEAFRVNVLTQARFDQVMAATKRQTASMLQRDPDKRPYPATWLDGARWDDEPSRPAIEPRRMPSGLVQGPRLVPTQQQLIEAYKLQAETDEDPAARKFAEDWLRQNTKGA
jgi:uncharacterized protein YdaU (DUF1376 family)